MHAFWARSGAPKTKSRTPARFDGPLPLIYGHLMIRPAQSGTRCHIACLNAAME